MARFISLFFLMMVTSGFSKNAKLTLPSVKIKPAINEYYEGDRVELQCTASGHPTPGTTWQRADRHPLPPAVEVHEGLFIIPSAKQEDSGEYICIAWNAVGATAARTASFTVRPPRRRLTVTPAASTLTEGQSTRLVCTGTTKVTASTINWIRQDGTEFMTNVRSNNGVLYIDIARLENQGVYICKATSPDSEVTPVPVLVTVLPLGPPPPSEPNNVTVSVGRMKIPTGGGGTVDCNPTGYPLHIKWKKHQGAFGPGVSQRDNTLVINNATNNDQGYYKCEGITGSTAIAVTYVFVEIEKCEEYSKSVVRTVYAIGLLTGLPTMYVKTAACHETVESIPRGATNVKPREFPHLVAVGWKDQEGGYYFECGGTLISPRFVLSDPACQYYARASGDRAVVQLIGVHREYFAMPGRSQIVAIKSIYRHPEYKPPIRYDNIVLIELQKKVDITADIRPACLWTKPDFDGRNKAISVGFSSEEYSSSPHQKVLQKSILSLLEKERCEQLAPGYDSTFWGLRPTQMCAGVIDGGKDKFCQDDAGFPLQVTADHNQCIHYVMGVTSFGLPCTTASVPTIYTRVSSYLDWIEGIVWPGE